jgi:hypothetical protein
MYQPVVHAESFVDQTELPPRVSPGYPPAIPPDSFAPPHLLC